MNQLPLRALSHMMPSVDHAAVLLSLGNYIHTNDESYLFKALYKFAEIYSYDIGTLAINAVESFDRVSEVADVMEEIVVTFLKITLKQDSPEEDMDYYFAALIFAESENNADNTKC